MKGKKDGTNRTIRFLKWVREHSGLWYLICTPDEEHMNLDMMRRLICQLYEKGFYELIFVLLTVHRDNPCFSHLPEYLLLDGMIARWDDERDSIIQEMQAHLE